MPSGLHSLASALGVASAAKCDRVSLLSAAPAPSVCEPPAIAKRPGSGSQPGERRGGRAPGTPNKTTLMIRDAMNAAAAKIDLSALEVTPLEFMMGLMADKTVDPNLRFKAAAESAKYLHPKPVGGPTDAADEAKLVIEALSEIDREKLDALSRRYHEIALDGEFRQFTDQPALTEAEKRERTAEMAAIEAVVPQSFLYPVEPPDPVFEEALVEMGEILNCTDASAAPYEPPAETRQRLEDEMEPPPEVISDQAVDADEEPALPQKANGRRAAVWPSHFPAVDPLVPDDLDDAARPSDDGAED